ncbi:MAG: hypothetical protein ACJ76G_14340 [Solirubrobacterales bacterium]
MDHKDNRNHARSAIGAMYAGIGLTIVALIVPYIDHATANVLADHIRDGYPTYSQARIASAVTTYLVYLSVVGALGTISWLSIWAVKAGKRGAHAAATALFALGTSIALTDLLIRDTSGDTGLPPLLGWVGDASVPGRALRGDAAVEEIVTSTSSHRNGWERSDDWSTPTRNRAPACSRC